MHTVNVELHTNTYLNCFLFLYYTNYLIVVFHSGLQWHSHDVIHFQNKSKYLQ